MRVSGMAVAGIIALILIGISVVPGCVSQAPAGNGTAAMNVTETPPALTVTPGFPGQPPYIIINPVGNHHAGDVFEINGTTNIGAGERLRYSVSRPGYAIPIPVPTGCKGGCPSDFQYVNGSDNISYGGMTTVIDGLYRQKWSFLLNTSGPGYHLGLFYILNVSAEDRPVQNSTTFDIWG